MGLVVLLVRVQCKCEHWTILDFVAGEIGDEDGNDDENAQGRGKTGETPEISWQFGPHVPHLACTQISWVPSHFWILIYSACFFLGEFLMIFFLALWIFERPCQSFLEIREDYSVVLVWRKRGCAKSVSLKKKMLIMRSTASCDWNNFGSSQLGQICKICGLIFWVFLGGKKTRNAFPSEMHISGFQYQNCFFFYTDKASRDLHEMYEKELKLKRTIVENIAHTKDRDLIMFYTASWIHEPFLDEKFRDLLEAMVIETGHKPCWLDGQIALWKSGSAVVGNTGNAPISVVNNLLFSV